MATPMTDYGNCTRSFAGTGGPPRPCPVQAISPDGLCAAHHQLAAVAEHVELQRRAVAVVRIWDMLARCSDEFEPEDMRACGEYRDNLDEAIIGLMQIVDRERWEQREAEMRAAASITDSE